MSTKDCVQDLCHQEQSNELLLTSEYVFVLFLLCSFVQYLCCLETSNELLFTS